MVETKAFDLGRDSGMRGWPLTTRLLVALAAGVVAGPSGLANSRLSKSSPGDRPRKAWVGRAKQ